MTQDDALGSEDEVTPDEDARRIALFQKELREGKTCPFCHEGIEQHAQLTRGIYARPCGHRLRIFPPRRNEKRKAWKRNYAVMGMWRHNA